MAQFCDCRHNTYMTDTGVLAKIEAEAAQYLSAGEWTHALAEYSVLREIRSRREGPYSVTYLSNLHDCVRCMSPAGAVVRQRPSVPRTAQ